MANYQHLTHTFEPIYNAKSQILILGSFPSVKSRENDFYYGHPQNRFWKVLALLTQSPIPETTADKKAFLLSHHIAVWDVIASCDIIGSSDSSIKNVIAANPTSIIQNSSITQIFANGTKAYELYTKYTIPMLQADFSGQVPSILTDIKKLPSTSPANAAFSLSRLEESWKILLDSLLL